jgi:hypothetical protein
MVCFGPLSQISWRWVATYCNICRPDIHDALPIQIKCRDSGSTKSGKAHDP